VALVKKPKKEEKRHPRQWQTGYSPRPPTSPYRSKSLHAGWSPVCSSTFQVLLKSVQWFWSCGWSKIAFTHYFGQWLIQQLVLPYKPWLWNTPRRTKQEVRLRDVRGCEQGFSSSLLPAPLVARRKRINVDVLITVLISHNVLDVVPPAQCTHTTSQLCYYCWQLVRWVYFQVGSCTVLYFHVRWLIMHARSRDRRTGYYAERKLLFSLRPVDSPIVIVQMFRVNVGNFVSICTKTERNSLKFARCNHRHQQTNWSRNDWGCERLTARW